MKPWLVYVGGRALSETLIGLIDRDGQPFVHAAQVASLYGVPWDGRLDPLPIFVTQRAEPSVGGPELVTVSKVADWLQVPAQVLGDERIIRLGRHEPSLQAVSIHLVPRAPHNSTPGEKSGLTQAATDVARRLARWLDMHGADARLVEQYDIGQPVDADPYLSLHIRLTRVERSAGWGRVFYVGRGADGHLAAAMRPELRAAWEHSEVLSCDREVCSEMHGVGCAVELGLTEHETAAVLPNPWYREALATAMFCGVRRFLDSRGIR